MVLARKSKQSRPISFRRGLLVGAFDGLFLLLLWGFLTTLGPITKLEINYWLKNHLYFCRCPSQSAESIGSEEFFLSLDPPDLNFSLVIPKIEARARIIANIDASNPSQYYPALKKGIAHAKGTVFPGMKGTIYLFAHSASTAWDIAQYNAVFYLLRELEPGDLIVVFFSGRGYSYQVSEKKIVDANETGFFSQKNEELLVLQTCHPPGTTLKALLIFARPSKPELTVNRQANKRVMSENGH